MPVRNSSTAGVNLLRPQQFAQRDLETCLNVCPERIGQEFIGYDRALAAWRILTKSVSFQSAVVGALRPINGHPILGFGASVFVKPEFAGCVLSHPTPGLNERVIASIDRGQSVLLSEAELRRYNTDGGLNMVILFSHWPKDVGLSAKQIDEVKLQLATIGVERFSGYRLERLIMEAFDEVDIEYFESTGVWRFVSNFEEYYEANPDPPWKKGRRLAVIDKVSAFSIVGSAAGMVFQYSPPVLRFCNGDQELLIAAIGGMTDQELAHELGLKLNTVKKRWASIFARVEDVMPSLLPSAADGADRLTRGPQKRHHLLAYLRQHPEELRPFLR